LLRIAPAEGNVGILIENSLCDCKEGNRSVDGDDCPFCESCDVSGDKPGTAADIKDKTGIFQINFEVEGETFFCRLYRLQF
jgi:hypothetical protein